jgi:diguanylate cyclase
MPADNMVALRPGDAGASGMTAGGARAQGLLQWLRDGTLATAFAAAMGLIALFADTAPPEQALRAMRDAVRSQSASGDLHIVEIDAASIQAVDRWPWPRREHARLIDALHEAGARSIAFDVDFSTASNPADDATLARSLERAGGGVILPTLRQAGTTRDRRIIESQPVAPLRDHAMLAAASILPDRDGYVREAPFGIVTGGTPRPSLSAMLAGRAGGAFESFPIDYAIDPDTIPRHSFIDIAHGRGAAALRGKDVLVGATAVELGDRYAVPRHGVIPGVAIQALAAETLRRGDPLVLPAAAILILGIAAAAFVARGVGARVIWVRAGLFAALLMLATLAAEELASTTAILVPALLAVGCAAGVAAINHHLAGRRAAARIDAASDLPNRLALAETATQTVVAAIVDRFDEVAAGIGSERTGTLVRRLAERLSPAIGGTVHRLDERAIAWDASSIAPDRRGESFDALRALLLHPIEVDGRRIDIRLGLGVADRGDGTTAAAIEAALLAASRALDRGEFWASASDESPDAAAANLSLMGELDAAIDDGELDVHFQPKLRLSDRRIASAEALVRWTHRERGPMRPDLFIPMAERHDRIDRLTLYVVGRTLDALEAAPGVSIAVNISAKLVAAPRFHRALDALLDARPAHVSRLIFEVTESAAMADIDGAVAALERYRARGIAISMDDYGTGQSTLTYIKRLPLAELKIDRSFVQHAHRNRGDGILVHSTVQLAHELGIKVVAEGVEDAECLAFLESCGCDYAQGWLIARPLPLDAFVARVSEPWALAA